MKSIIIIIILLLTNISADTISEQKKDLNEIEKAKQQAIKDIEKNKKLQKKLKIQIYDNERKVKQIQDEISGFSEKVFYLKNKIIGLEDNIFQIENNLKKLKKKFKKRLVAIYKNKGTSYLSLFFNTKDLSKFTTRFKMIKRIIIKDNELFDKIKNDLIRLQEKKEELSSKRSSISILEKNLLEKRKELERIKIVTEKTLKIKEEEHKILKKQYEEYLMSSKKIGEMISKLEKKRLEKVKNKETKVIKKENIVKETKPIFDTKKIKEDEAKKRKKIDMIWPVDGDVKIISGFGKQKNEMNTVFENKGIDIEIKEGSNIKAAADGIVMYKGQMNGYGKIVIIDHGYGLTTLYAHLEDINVGIRQKILKGEYIAKVGVINNEEKCSLHFEVRIYGNPENPINLF